MRARAAHLGALAATMALLLMLLTPAAAAAVPTNDDWQFPTTITDLPFHVSQDTTDATSQLTSCGGVRNVWFSFTASREIAIRIDTTGSDYDTEIGTYVLMNGYPELVSCATDALTQPQAVATVRLLPGTTYLFAVGGWDSGGQLLVDMREVAIPANDAFGDATVITSLPFHESVDVVAASSGPLDPVPSCEGRIDHTVWYAFTPTHDIHITSEVTTSYWAVQAVYTGTPGTFTEVVCESYNWPASFLARAGVTYYFEVGDAFGTGLPVTFDLGPAPEVVVDPFVVDTCNSTQWDSYFIDHSWDPGGMDIVRREWEFGDGTTGTGYYVSHRYAQDGTYAVTLSVETSDGRIGTATRSVTVGTHDVSVVDIEAPATARNRQTTTLTVEVRNTRLPEGVTVNLLASVPGGYREVGLLWQPVPVRTRGATDFEFLYTFSREESGGRLVTFVALAKIDVCQDSFPEDNQVMSAPVKIIG